jgi:early secretory antigenic target protein ESAT-6
MTRYQVDSEAVFAAAGAVRGTIGRIRAEVEAMHGQLGSLQGSWTGEAALAFQAVVADWNATQLRVEESLNTINLALGHAGQGYADVEAANARLFVR